MSNSVLTSKIAEVYEQLKAAALLAVEHGIDAYDFRRASNTAINQAALEHERGNVSRAARLLKIHRNSFVYRLKNGVPGGK